MKLTANNMDSWFGTVWEALWEAQDCADPIYPPDKWDDICTAMAWIAEAAGHEMEMDP
jgi:hypothetical protein